jgi:hypothetical protein
VAYFKTPVKVERVPFQDLNLKSENESDTLFLGIIVFRFLKL